jgi:hypothetical protein
VLAYGCLPKGRNARSLRVAAASALMFLSTAPGQAEFSTNDAITTLQIFGQGGADLVAEVSTDVISDVSAIGSYCLAAGSASLDQKVAIVRGILVATEGAPGTNDEDLTRLSRQCCPLFTAVPIDQRIEHGARLAMEAREIYGEDRGMSGRMQTLVHGCADDVLDTSFALALGNDRIGLFIAQASPAEAAVFRTASGPEDIAAPDAE